MNNPLLGSIYSNLTKQAFDWRDTDTPVLPGYTPPMPEQHAGWLGALGAAFQDNTLTAAYHLFNKPDFEADPNFNFDEVARSSPAFNISPDAFYDVQSESQFRYVESQVLAHQRDLETLASAGWKGYVAAFASGSLDPVNLLPAGTIYRTVRVGGLMRTLYSTAAAGAGAAAVGEVILRADQPSRTPEESAISVLGGAVLGGVLGGGLYALGARPLRELASDMAGVTVPRTIYQPASHPSSIGAALNPEAPFLRIAEDAQIADAYGSEQFLRLNPVGRVLLSRTSATARAMMASLDTGGLEFKSVANVGGDIEAAAKQHMGLIAKALMERNRVIKETRWGNVRDFNEAVVKALRRGAATGDKAVDTYAQWLRTNVFEPFRKEAQWVGMKEFQNLDADYIEKYAPRMARHSLIARDFDEFEQILIEHYTERLTQEWAQRLEVVKARNETDLENADILEMTPDTMAAYRAKLEEEMAKLPDEQPIEARTIIAEIQRLRDEAKAVSRDEAKDLRAQAKALEESNKELLGDFSKKQRKLKMKFRFLDRTQQGIIGRNQNILDRIEKLVDGAAASRAYLLKRLDAITQKIERAENISPQALKGLVTKARNQLKEAKARELELLRLSGDDPRLASEAFDSADAQLMQYEEAFATMGEADARFRAAGEFDKELVVERLQNIKDEVLQHFEVMAGRSQARMKKLTDELRNPAEANAEAAALRRKAQLRSRNLVERAAEQNVRLEGDSFDISARAKILADAVASEYMGEHARLPFFNIIGGERGAELARTLDIDETRTWSNGKKFEDFLENDLEIVLRAYGRTLAPDIELMRKFGTVNPLSKSSPFMAKIEEDFQLARDAAPFKQNKKGEFVLDAEGNKIALSPEEVDKKLQAIADERRAVIRDISGVLERVRNLRNVPRNPYAIGIRLGRTALNLNTVRMMGKMVFASINDVAMLMTRHGPLEFIKHGMLPMISDWKRMRLTLDEARLAGVATDLTLHGRSAAFGDVFDNLRMGIYAERGLQYFSSHMGIVSGMDHWNTALKTLGANMTAARLSDVLSRFNTSGKISAADEMFLRRFGIDEATARDMWKEWTTTGNTYAGTILPNTEEWGKRALLAGDEQAYFRALELKRIFRTALAREVDDTIVTPGSEIPLWMDESMGGRLLGQFRRFTFSSTSKTLVAGLQRARAHGRVTGSIMALSALPFFLASGALSYYLWAVTSGEKARERMMNADFETWLTESILRGLPLGVLSEVPRWEEDFLGIRTDSSKTNHESSPVDLLGPSIDLLADIGRAGQGLTGLITRGEQLSQREASSLKQLFPYNNLHVLDLVTRPMFESLAK